MNINTNSWHYRLVYIFNYTNIPTNLCSYVREVCICILLTIGIMSFIGILLAGIFSFVLAFLPWFDIDYDGFFFILGLTEFIIVTAVASFYGIVFLCRAAHNAWYRRKRRQMYCTDTNEPNIFVEYAKAAKNKLCPMITFVTLMNKDDGE